MYHDIALQHLQPWGPVGLQQSVDHVLELALLLSRNAIPGQLGDRQKQTLDQDPLPGEHMLGPP